MGNATVKNKGKCTHYALSPINKQMVGELACSDAVRLGDMNLFMFNVYEMRINSCNIVLR
jgi:hypothetical protein